MTIYHQILQCVFPYNALVIDPVDNFFSSVILACTSCCFTIQTHRFFFFCESYFFVIIDVQVFPGFANASSFELALVFFKPVPIIL